MATASARPVNNVEGAHTTSEYVGVMHKTVSCAVCQQRQIIHIVMSNGYLIAVHRLSLSLNKCII